MTNGPPRFDPREAERLRLLLKLVHFLEHLDEPHLDALVAGMEERHFRKGEALVREGEKGDAFFIIARGSAKVRKKSEGRDVEIGSLGPFTFFGELALLYDIPRTATVRAEEDGQAYVLTRASFERILLATPGIAASIRQTAARRMSGLLGVEEEEDSGGGSWGR